MIRYIKNVCIARKIRKILKHYPEFKFLIGKKYIHVWDNETHIALTHEFKEPRYGMYEHEELYLLKKIYDVFGWWIG